VKVTLKALSATRQKKVRDAIADQKVRKVREDLLTALFGGFTLTGALPPSCEKVSVSVRTTVATAQKVDTFTLPTDWSAPGRSTVENVRLFIGKYLLPVWPELAAVWADVLLAENEDGLPTLFPIERG